MIYGGYKPEVSNVIFTNGDVDPWHKLSVLLDLNESTPAILIKGTYRCACVVYTSRIHCFIFALGASHCQDFMNDFSTDLPDLREARKTVRKIVAKWITS